MWTKSFSLILLLVGLGIVDRCNATPQLRQAQTPDAGNSIIVAEVAQDDHGKEHGDDAEHKARGVSVDSFTTIDNGAPATDHERVARIGSPHASAKVASSNDVDVAMKAYGKADARPDDEIQTLFGNTIDVEVSQDPVLEEAFSSDEANLVLSGFEATSAGTGQEEVASSDDCEGLWTCSRQGCCASGGTCPRVCYHWTVAGIKIMSTCYNQTCEKPEPVPPCGAGNRGNGECEDGYTCCPEDSQYSGQCVISKYIDYCYDRSTLQTLA